MPNIIVKAPKGVFDAAGRAAIAAGLTQAAKQVEQIGDEPRHAMQIWIAIEEIAEGCLFAGGHDALKRIIPVFVQFYVPAGVVDGNARADAVRLVQAAIASAKPASDSRPVVTSVIVADVAEGTWGGNGALLSLRDLARAAGYKHLQHLIGGHRMEGGTN
jgi:phenylpyruvate tautomerase PptA (4-oxalocrotonate tautomerase family)